MTKTIKEIRRFETLADDGSTVPIIEFQWVTIERTVNGKLTTMESPVLLGLTDGTQVNRVKDKTYRVLSTGQVLREIS